MQSSSTSSKAILFGDDKISQDISKSSNINQLIDNIFENCRSRTLPEASFIEFLSKLNELLSDKKNFFTKENFSKLSHITKYYIEVITPQNIAAFLREINKVSATNRAVFNLDEIHLFEKSLNFLKIANPRQAYDLVSQLSKYGFSITHLDGRWDGDLSFLQKSIVEFNRNPATNAVSMTLMLKAVMNLGMLDKAKLDGLIDRNFFNRIYEEIIKKVQFATRLDSLNAAVNSLFELKLYCKEVLDIAFPDLARERVLARVLTAKSYLVNSGKSSLTHRKAARKLYQQLSRSEAGEWSHVIHRDDNVIKIGDNIEMVMEYPVGDSVGVKFKPVDLAIFLKVGDRKILFAIIEFDGDAHFVRRGTLKNGNSLERDKVLQRISQGKFLSIPFLEFENFIKDPLNNLRSKGFDIDAAIKDIVSAPVLVVEDGVSEVAVDEVVEGVDVPVEIVRPSADSAVVAMPSSPPTDVVSGAGKGSGVRVGVGKKGILPEKAKRMAEEKKKEEEKRKIVAAIKTSISDKSFDIEYIKEIVTIYPGILNEVVGDAVDSDGLPVGETIAQFAAKFGDLKSFIELVKLGMSIREIDIAKAPVKGKSKVVKASERGNPDAEEISNFIGRARAIKITAKEIKSFLIEVCKSGNEQDFYTTIASINQNFPNPDVLPFEVKRSLNDILIFACYYGRIEFVEELLSRYKMDINHYFRELNPLNAAIQNGHIDIAILLTERGANCKSLNKDGISPLMVAVEMDEEEIVNYLLEKIADTDISEMFIRASRFNSVKVLTLLSNRVDIKGKVGSKALIMAATFGHKQALEFLLNNGASPSAKDKIGIGILTYAANFGNRDVVEFLLQEGFKIDEIDDEGKTALMHVISSSEIDLSKKKEMIQFLLDNGANINHMNIRDETVLIYALLSSKIDIEDKKEITCFLAEEAKSRGVENIEYKTSEGEVITVNFISYITPKKETALMHVTVNNRIKNLHKKELVKLLLKLGVDIVSKDEGATTIINVVKYGNLEMLKFLLSNDKRFNIIEDRDSKGRTALMHLVGIEDLDELERLNKIKFLLECGVRVDDLDEKGSTALAHAAYFGRSLGTLKCLLDAGANVNGIVEGEAPLIKAVRFGNIGGVKFLLDAGANVNIRGDSRRTALQYAVCINENDVVNLLLERGADAELKDLGGINAFGYAAWCANIEIVEFLWDTKKFSINDMDASGRTVLMNLIVNDRLNFDKKEETIRFLISKGADIGDEVLECARSCGVEDELRKIISSAKSGEAYFVRSDSSKMPHATIAEPSHNVEVESYEVVDGVTSPSPREGFSYDPDLKYWLSGDDIQLALCAKNLIELEDLVKTQIVSDRDGHQSLRCISRAVGVEEMALLVKQEGAYQTSAELTRFFTEEVYPKTLLIPIISGSHVIAMKVILQKEAEIINAKVSFFDPHGLEEGQIPNNIGVDFFGLLEESLNKNIGLRVVVHNATMAHPRQQYNEGPCGDFVCEYIVANAFGREFLPTEEASVERDFMARLDVMTSIMKCEEIASHKKERFFLSSSKISSIAEDKKGEAFWMKFQKVLDSSLISHDEEDGGYDLSDFRKKFFQVLDSYDSYDILLERLDYVRAAYDESLSMELSILELLLEGQGEVGIVGGIDPLIPMLLVGEEGLNEAYEKIKRVFRDKFKSPSASVVLREGEAENTAVFSDKDGMSRK